MPEKLSRRYTKYFWKTIAYHLQTWRLLSIITKTCWGAPVTSNLQLFVSLPRQREKISPVSTMFAFTSFPESFTWVYRGALGSISRSDAAASKFHSSSGTWCWSCFQSKDLAGLFTPLQISLYLNQAGWVLEMWLLLYNGIGFLFKTNLHLNVNLHCALWCANYFLVKNTLALPWGYQKC